MVPGTGVQRVLRTKKKKKMTLIDSSLLACLAAYTKTNDPTETDSTVGTSTTLPKDFSIRFGASPHRTHLRTHCTHFFFYVFTRQTQNRFCRTHFKERQHNTIVSFTCAHREIEFHQELKSDFSSCRLE